MPASDIPLQTVTHDRAPFGRGAQSDQDFPKRAPAASYPSSILRQTPLKFHSKLCKPPPAPPRASMGLAHWELGTARYQRAGSAGNRGRPRVWLMPRSRRTHGHAATPRCCSVQRRGRELLSRTAGADNAQRRQSTRPNRASESLRIHGCLMSSTHEQVHVSYCTPEAYRSPFGDQGLGFGSPPSRALPPALWTGSTPKVDEHVLVLPRLSPVSSALITASSGAGTLG